MRRLLRDMGTVERIVWLAECVPGAVLISIVLTMSFAILADIEFKAAGLLGFIGYFVPGFIIGMLLMMVISALFGSALLGLLRVFGVGGK